MEARASLCRRWETKCRGWPKSTVKREDLECVVDKSEEDAKDAFPVVCGPTQCLLCLSDKSYPIYNRSLSTSNPTNGERGCEALKKASPWRMRFRARIHSARQRDWSCPVRWFSRIIRRGCRESFCVNRPPHATLPVVTCCPSCCRCSTCVEKGVFVVMVYIHAFIYAATT